MIPWRDNTRDPAPLAAGVQILAYTNTAGTIVTWDAAHARWMNAYTGASVAFAFWCDIQAPGSQPQPYPDDRDRDHDHDHHRDWDDRDRDDDWRRR